MNASQRCIDFVTIFQQFSKEKFKNLPKLNKRKKKLAIVVIQSCFLQGDISCPCDIPSLSLFFRFLQIYHHKKLTVQNPVFTQTIAKKEKKSRNPVMKFYMILHHAVFENQPKYPILSNFVHFQFCPFCPMLSNFARPNVSESYISDTVAI